MSHPPGFATEPPTIAETGYTWKNRAVTFQGLFSFCISTFHDHFCKPPTILPVYKDNLEQEHNCKSLEVTKGLQGRVRLVLRKHAVDTQRKARRDFGGRQSQ